MVKDDTGKQTRYFVGTDVYPSYTIHNVVNE